MTSKAPGIDLICQPEGNVSVVYLTQDLFFSTRVTEMAKRLGLDLAVVGTVEQLIEKLAQPVSAVLVDLEHKAAQPEAVVRIVAAASPRPRLLGYGPHVKEALLQAAQAAGFDRVYSRGEFDKQIGSVLQSLCTPS